MGASRKYAFDSSNAVVNASVLSGENSTLASLRPLAVLLNFK
jgi:hypothetical protein